MVWRETNDFGTPMLGGVYDWWSMPMPLVIPKYKKPREPTLGEKYNELQEFLNKINR